MTGSDLPPQVEELHSAFGSLLGVVTVASGIESIAGVTGEQLSNFAYRTLPHGTLRRTNGAIGDEAIVWVELTLEQTESGWRALEFLAWWVRDMARGGVPIELSPFGLPPVVGSNVQLGTSLSLFVHAFRLDAGTVVNPHLEFVAQLARDLTQALDLYDSLLVQRGAQYRLRPVFYGA